MAGRCILKYNFGTGISYFGLIFEFFLSAQIKMNSSSERIAMKMRFPASWFLFSHNEKTLTCTH